MIVHWRRRLSAIVFILLSGCSASRSKLHFLSAERLWQQGQFEAAAQEYRSVVNLAGSDALGLHAKERLAFTEAYSLKHPQIAKQYFEELINSPDAAMVQKRVWREHRAWLLVDELQRAEEGLSILLELLDTEDSPQRKWDLRYRLSHAYARHGAFDRAVGCLKGEIRPEAVLWKLQLLSMKRDLPLGTIGQEVQDISDRIGNDPVAGEVAFEYGALLESLGKLEEAKKWFQSAEQTHPHPDLVSRRIERILPRLDQKTEKGKAR